MFVQRFQWERTLRNRYKNLRISRRKRQMKLSFKTQRRDVLGITRELDSQANKRGISVHTRSRLVRRRPQFLPKTSHAAMALSLNSTLSLFSLEDFSQKLASVTVRTIMDGKPSEYSPVNVKKVDRRSIMLTSRSFLTSAVHRNFLFLTCRAPPGSPLVVFS